MNKYFVYFAFNLFSILSFSQGYNSNLYNFDAIAPSKFNQALIANNNMNWQANLVGFDVNAANNYFKINLKDIMQFDKNKNIEEILNGTTKNVHLGFDILGPSAMFRIKTDNVISITTRARGILSINDIDEKLASSLYNDFNGITNWLPNIQDGRVTAGVNAYHQIGIGFGRSIFKNPATAFHFAANVSMLTNIFNTQFIAKDVNFNKIYQNATDSFINVGNSQFEFLTSDNLEGNNYKYKFGVDGITVDVGFIYEHRKARSNEPSIRVGIGVNDIGFNKYKIGNNSRTFVGNNKNVNASHLVDSNGETIELDRVLDSLGTKTTPTGTIKTKTPMTMTLFGDFKIVKHLYVSASTQLNLLTYKRGAGKANLPTDITITPRFDSKMFGASIPINYNKYAGFNAGIGIRIAQVTLGSSNIITTFVKKNFTAINFYANIAFGGRISRDMSYETRCPVHANTNGAWGMKQRSKKK